MADSADVPRYRGLRALRGKHFLEITLSSADSGLCGVFARWLLFAESEQLPAADRVVSNAAADSRKLRADYAQCLGTEPYPDSTVESQPTGRIQLHFPLVDRSDTSYSQLAGVLIRNLYAGALITALTSLYCHAETGKELYLEIGERCATAHDPGACMESYGFSCHQGRVPHRSLEAQLLGCNLDLGDGRTTSRRAGSGASRVWFDCPASASQRRIDR